MFGYCFSTYVYTLYGYRVYFEVQLIDYEDGDHFDTWGGGDHQRLECWAFNRIVEQLHHQVS